MGRKSNKDKELEHKLGKYQPDNDLQRFCYVLISPDVKGHKEKAQEISRVDKGKFYYAYKTKPEFRLWFMDLCIQILDTNAAIPPYALLSAIVKGDVQAIRTYYEIIGKLKSGVHVDASQHTHYTLKWGTNGNRRESNRAVLSTSESVNNSR